MNTRSSISRFSVAAAALAAGLFTAQAQAGDGVLGAIIGGGAGAAIGHAVGGRGGAVIGGVVGAAVGAAATQRDSYGYGYDPYPEAGGYPAPVAYPSPPVVYPSAPVVYPAPAVVYPSPRVVYSPPPVVYNPAPRVVYQPVRVAPPRPVYHVNSGPSYRFDGDRGRRDHDYRHRPNDHYRR
ncbi:MAG: hypothetical protein J0H09_28685 [Burkholderiales bacterium]|nr:hypothetical protein [Burkholderiales bacterium]ODU72324.1 MAG: hypothetical protein ABT05_00450 [Lautropia sp. SCN 66-9]